MKTWCVVLLLLGPRFAFATVAGHLDFQSKPSYSAWQSVESPDQALGLSKRVFYVVKDQQQMLNVGLFGGAKKNLLDSSKTPKAVGGLTLAIPGSVLDWALGTKMGDAWVPALKTGVLSAYDLTRLKQIHWKPDFIGVGISYPVGG